MSKRKDRPRKRSLTLDEAAEALYGPGRARPRVEPIELVEPMVPMTPAAWARYHATGSPDEVGPDREATPAEQERQDAMMHHAALADRYRRALEQAHDVLAGGPSPVRSAEAKAILSGALDPDPRPGPPTGRYHWAHMQDGDKLIWRLVAELIELRDCQATVVGQPTLKHHPSLERKMARGQQKRADRYQRDLRRLDVAHRRLKGSVRKMAQTITRQHLALIAEREALVLARAAHEALAIEGAAALEAERENKANAVRVLRRAMRNAVSALGSIRSDVEGASTVAGAREHHHEALAAVMDPDDGQVH